HGVGGDGDVDGFTRLNLVADLTGGAEGEGHRIARVLGVLGCNALERAPHRLRADDLDLAGNRGRRRHRERKRAQPHQLCHDAPLLRSQPVQAWPTSLDNVPGATPSFCKALLYFACMSLPKISSWSG